MQLRERRIALADAVQALVDSTLRDAREVRFAPLSARPDLTANHESLFNGSYRDHLPIAIVLERHHTVDKGEQGVVVPTTHIVARVEPGPPLTHKDTSGADVLSPESLDAESLRIAVATVAA